MQTIRASILLLLFGVLGGCATETENTSYIQSVFIDKNNAIVDVSRVKARATYMADHRSWKPLVAREESYVVPLDFSKHETQALPAQSFDTLAWYEEDIFYGGPAVSLVRTPPQGDFYPTTDVKRKSNLKVFPVNNGKIIWTGSGRDGYAYVDSESHRMTYVATGAEPCAIEVRKRDLATTLVYWISNDGRYLAIGEYLANNQHVDIYWGCNKVTAQDFPSRGGEIRGMCVADGEYWYWQFNPLSSEITAFQGNSKEHLTLPRNVYFPLKPVMAASSRPIFDCERKTFFWTSTGAPSDYVAIDLYEYDPATSRKGVMHLKLGGPL